ncbi:PHP domain-containing protein [Limnoglobus roseus]|uniref:PHP domain-containing protein n=1 Tax=Limnoglobus roseus TaxID=2598579 RepID=A0A5C1AHS5_9BACT|nr:PHP domain-containing protein [Limnoglobus roseus]QEL18989.1 PHP domain-containing protein [Limnoglobus roseus]
MPRRQPFTALCQHAANLARPALADLHTHTLASDGEFTASQIVAFAVQAGLKAVAITDHDTTAGFAEAEAAIRANRSPIELIPGVELSTFWDDREYHLLAYFVRPDVAFQEMLRQLQEARERRFQQFRQLLRERGLSLIESNWDHLAVSTPSLGRRHVARELVRAGVVRRLHDAFRHFVLPLSGQVDRLRVISLRDALDRVRAAGGVASLAHPSAEFSRDQLTVLRDWGLGGVEVQFPAVTYSRSLELRAWAGELGLGCTGGSDCHGPERRVGCRTIPMHDLLRFRQSATSAGCAGGGDRTPSVELRN